LILAQSPGNPEKVARPVWGVGQNGNGHADPPQANLTQKKRLRNWFFGIFGMKIRENQRLETRCKKTLKIEN
jgi:hypothetical protein